jgi:hypothetical protein
MNSKILSGKRNEKPGKYDPQAIFIQRNEYQCVKRNVVPTEELSNHLLTFADLPE